LSTSQPSYPALPAAPPTHTLAIVSLVTGILGLTVCSGIGSVAALVSGYIARDEMRKRPGQYSGEGLALAGVILGWVGIGIWVLSLALAFIALIVTLVFSIFFSLNLIPLIGKQVFLLPGILFG